MCKWNAEALAAKLYEAYLDALYEQEDLTSSHPRKPSEKLRAANWRALGAAERTPWIRVAEIARERVGV